MRNKESVVKEFSQHLTWFQLKFHWHGRRNSTTAEEVSRSQCLYHNPNWLVWKGIPPPKFAEIPMGEQLADGDFSSSGRVKSCKVSSEVWLSTLGQTSDPSLAWKRVTFSK